ncbi:hypothetical protein AB0F91_45565 [Amycolatopsis sp. NPDC023774]|uniref:hypothetical protein n=1 Tax=Amycolatopsis sp. NPDC023774 TaxID=3155015 RepID=UPI0033E20ADD
MPDTSSPAPNRIAYAELDVFADYGSFLVQDDTARPDTNRAFITDLMNNLIATTDGAIGVGTARRRTLPVILDVRTEAGLRTTSGRLVVSKFDYRPTIPRTTVPPGDYTARTYANGFDTNSEDRIDGDDTYRVVLWPGPIVEPRVLKRYPNLPISG